MRTQIVQNEENSRLASMHQRSMRPIRIFAFSAPEKTFQRIWPLLVTVEITLSSELIGVGQNHRRLAFGRICACVARRPRKQYAHSEAAYSGEDLSYDPRRLQGVMVYRDSERKFAQGDRVLIHVDTEQAPELVNSGMAYVSVSRAQFDAQMYTNDAKALGYELNKDVSKATALSRHKLGEMIEPLSVDEELSKGLSVG